MEAALRANVFDGLADALRIVIEPGGNDLWARGAACVVLSALFTSPIHQMAVIPTLSLYLLLNNLVIKGLTGGAVKG